MAGHPVGFKANACTSDQNFNSTARGHVGNTRQEKVNTAYYKAASDLGAIVHNAPPDEKLCIKRKLREYGHSGRVLGPVNGVYGSGFNDLSLLSDLAASELARRHIEH